MAPNIYYGTNPAKKRNEDRKGQLNALSSMVSTPKQQTPLKTSTNAPKQAQALSSIQNNDVAAKRGALVDLQRSSANPNLENQIQSLNERLATKQGGFDKLVAKLGGQTSDIPLNIVQGQQASVRRQAAAETGADARLLDALAGQLGTAEKRRTNDIEAAKTELGFLESDREAEMDQIGEGFTLSEGQQRFDVQGNLIAAGPEKTGKAEIRTVGKNLLQLNPQTGQWDVVYTSPDGADLKTQITEVDGRKAVVNQRTGEVIKFIEEGKQDVNAAYAETKANTVISTIDEALQDASKLTTGLIGSIASRVPGSPAYDLARKIDTIKANVGFQELQKMREASPTGGALGQVAVQELNFLQSVLGSLDQAQSREELVANLNQVREHFENWKNAVIQSQTQDGGLNQQEQTTIEQMRADGIPDDVIQEVIGKPLSFSGVGGDTNQASRIAQAIKQVESGGNYEARGASGESGAYQFMPGTWKQWAGEVLGNPNAPLTPENQDRVAQAKIEQWMNQGYNPEQIALMWNAGEPVRRKGVNSQGVPYDSGAYANKVLEQIYG